MKLLSISLLALALAVLAGCATPMPALLKEPLTDNNFKSVSREQDSQHAEWMETFRRDDGTQIHTLAWLPEEGTVHAVVLCIHGMSGHSGYFKSFGHALRGKGLAVYAMDLRGNGLSGVPGDVESADQQLSDMKLFMDYLRLKHPGKPVYLLGHSLGAGYALKYAASVQDHLAGLILLAPGVKPVIPWSPEVVWTMLTMGFRYALTPRQKWDTTLFWPKELQESELGKNVAADKLSVKEFTYRYAMTLPDISGGAMLENGAMLAIPALVVQGNKDTVVVAEKSKLLYQKIPAQDKRLIELDDADHDLYGLFAASSYRELNEQAIRLVDTVDGWIK